MSWRTILLLASTMAAAPHAVAETPIETATERLEAKDFAGSRAILASELEADPQSAAAHYLLGRIALEEENPDSAIDLLKRAVALESESSTYRGWLGRAYITRLQSASFFEKGTLAGRALEQLRKAVELDRKNLQARTSLAYYYASAPSIAGGSLRKAREQVYEILKHDEVEGNVILASLHERQKEYEEAIERYQRCIEDRPEDTRCRYRLAMLHQKLERYDEAFEVLEGLLDVDPDATGAMYQIGRTAVFASKRLDRGIECLREYLERAVEPGHPSHGAAHWRMGMLFERQGKRDEARAAYEAAMRLDPDHEKYRESLLALGVD